MLGSIEKMNNDDVKYIRSAWHLLDTGKLIYNDVNEPTVYIMPGLPYVITFFMSLFGRLSGIVVFRIFQVLLQLFSIYLMFFIGRKAVGSRPAAIACVIDVLYIPEFYAPTLILTESIFKFLVLLLIYVSIYAVEEKKAVYYTLGGIVWGIACLFRPTIAAYPAVILIMWIIKKYSFKDMVKYALITTSIFCAIMCPWWIRNYKTFHRFIPTTLSSGNPFLQGTYINYDQSKDYVSYSMGKDTIERDRNETNTGLYRLKTYGSRHPLRYLLWYTIGKSLYFWGLPFYWKEMLHVYFPAAVLYHFGILLLGIKGTILGLRKSRNSLIIFLSAAYFNLVHLPYFAFSRYSYPVMPVVIIFAANAVYHIIKERKEAHGEIEGINS
jgi:4-amino-4-deoxy-L-arabinose transferase-like glycosyltransferase